MHSNSQDELVEIITREVIKLISAKSEVPDSKGNKPGVLVLGSPEKLPPQILTGVKVYTADDYALDGELDQYSCIYITELGLNQLSDIALGRNERPFQCAVIKAILSGKRVVLLAEALTYHRFARTANKEFYQMLVGYEKKIAGYGVNIIPAAKLINADRPDKGCQNDNSLAVDCTDQVITGKKAEELCSRIKETVNLKKGTILTPLAKDAFGTAKIKINFI